MKYTTTHCKCDRCHREVPVDVCRAFADNKFDYGGGCILATLKIEIYQGIYNPDICEDCWYELLKLAVHDIELKRRIRNGE